MACVSTSALAQDGGVPYKVSVGTATTCPMLRAATRGATLSACAGRTLLPGPCFTA